ncbi:MAG: HNH endonuclease, partial [Actinomycetota bacterium]|nr:HNH endonuclease [Actinomycetota bacterium]
GALAAGAEFLACACGRSDCPGAGNADARATNVVVHVVAEAAAVDAAADPQLSGEIELDGPGARPQPAATRPGAPSGRIIGGGSVPPGLLAELIAGGAAVRPLRQPAESSAQPGYRPSAALAAFVRARDMTCRFPGCDRPATRCDIDHAVAFPFGPTHPGNLRCLCRKHHLLKTFWTGASGWHDHQHPDGTIDWTSPTGHTYTTRPGSRLLFPGLCLPTAAPAAAAPAPPPDSGREVMMPIRRRTRARDRLSCVRAERARNLGQLDKPPP